MNKLSIKRSTRLSFWAHFSLNFYKYRAREGYYGPVNVEKKRRRIEKKIMSQSIAYGDGAETAVPSFDKDELSIEDFHENFLKKNKPVVIRGAGLDLPACKKWSLEFFKNNFGDDVVPCRKNGKVLSGDAHVLEDVLVSELVDNILNGGELTGSNMTDILNRHESLKKDLNIPLLEKYLCLKKSEINSTQLFMSGADTKTGFHAAGGVNMFLQVSGEKTWTFVDPKYTPWMYPVLRKDMFYTASEIPWLQSKDEITAGGFPLYHCVPKQIAKLKAGDLLFSPQWWWHAIHTHSSSIAIASRTMNHLLKGSAPYSLMWLTSKEFRTLVKDIISTGVTSDEKGGARLVFAK